MKRRVWWLIAFLSVAASSAAPGIIWGDDERGRDRHLDATAPVKRACRSGAAAHLDGDSRLDRTFHAYVGDEPILGVCLASGDVLTLPGAGMTEFFDVADINDDGRWELLYGGTSACGAGGYLAVVVGHALREIRFDDGEQLGVDSGCAGTGGMAEYGCNGRKLVQVLVEPVPDGVVWTREVFRIDADRAQRVSTTSGRRSAPPLRTEGDPSADPSARWAPEIPTDLLPTPCHTSPA